MRPETGITRAFSITTRSLLFMQELTKLRGALPSSAPPQKTPDTITQEVQEHSTSPERANPETDPKVTSSLSEEKTAASTSAS